MAHHYWTVLFRTEGRIKCSLFWIVFLLDLVGTDKTKRNSNIELLGCSCRACYWNLQHPAWLMSSHHLACGGGLPVTVVLGPDFFLLSETPYVSSQQDLHTSIPFPGQNEISISSQPRCRRGEWKGNLRSVWGLSLVCKWLLRKSGVSEVNYKSFTLSRDIPKDSVVFLICLF